jgi:hypothetical protein
MGKIYFKDQLNDGFFDILKETTLEEELGIENIQGSPKFVTIGPVKVAKYEESTYKDPILGPTLDSSQPKLIGIFDEFITITITGKEVLEN